MLNKDDIFKRLDNLNIDKNKYIVTNNASMVVQGVKDETSLIDISISNDLKLNKIDNINVLTTNYNTIDYIIINGYKFATLDYILKEKQKFNKKEDLKDIKLLDLHLCLKDNYRYEKELINNGITLICGVDEVGRGPLAGPVVAASVILPVNYKLDGLTDSKKLSEKKREEFYDIIMKDAVSVGVGIIDEKVIDEVNIYEATKLAMLDSINNLSVKPEHILIDAMKLDIDIPTTSIIKGDLKSLSISAASVIAKVTRDRMLDRLHIKYPYYNFKKNKGYPTKEHILAIENHGIIKEHRKSYGPVKEYLEKNKIK